MENRNTTAVQGNATKLLSAEILPLFQDRPDYPVGQPLSNATSTEAIVAKGKAAWEEEKKSVAAQQTRWLEIGNALLVGRKENPSNQKFGQWCEMSGFGDMDRRDRADAMWLSENWEALSSHGTTTYAHPKNIRQAYNDHLKARAVPSGLPTELQDAPPPIPSVLLEKRPAEKVNKLKDMSESDGPEAEMAQRQLRSYAEANGLDVEALLEAAAITDPAGRHKFTEKVNVGVEVWKTSIKASLPEFMRKQNLSIEAVKHLLINLAHSL